MKFLFLFNITPSKKLLYCIPIRVTLILIAIIATFFAIINFMGILKWDGAQDDLYFYFIQACGFLSPMLLIYTAFRDDYITADLAVMFHTYYVIILNLMYILLVLIFLIIDIQILNKMSIALIFQGIYNVFCIFANYVFFAFNYNYSDFFQDSPAVNTQGNSLIDG